MPSVRDQLEALGELGVLDSGDAESEDLSANTGNPDSSSTATVMSQEAFALARDDINFLGGLAIPEIFTFLFPPLYHSIFALLKQKLALARDFSKIAIGIPRGFAKTTFMKLVVLWIILFSSKKFILVVSSTATLAENWISDVASMLDERNIIQILGNWRMNMIRNTHKVSIFNLRGRVIVIASLGDG